MMNRYTETLDGYNALAGVYEDKFMHLELYNDTYLEFCNHIQKPDASILEIGCGPGNITRYLLEQKPNFNILATDFAEKMISLAQKNNPKADFMQLDARDIKTLNRQFDAVVCGFCIPYLTRSDCVKLIGDASDLLNEKGLLYLSFVPGDYDQSKYQTSSDGKYSIFFYYHPEEIITSQLIQSGFKVINTIHKNYPRPENQFETHTIIIAQKF